MLEELVKINPNIKNATLLANYLMQLERKDRARDVLKHALEDFQHAPSYIRRSEGKWVREAQEMLKSLTAAP